MTEKQPRCCALRQSALTTARRDLGNLAHRAAMAEQLGRDITGYKERIMAQKLAVAEQQRAVIDHEAEHAGEPVTV